MQQGRSVKNQAMKGISTAAKLEQNRNLTNDGIDRAETSAKTTNATAGATTGAMIGANVGAAATVAAAVPGAAAATGVGALGALGAGLATGGVGLVAGLLLSELF
jgi:predicted phage tail protein